MLLELDLLDIFLDAHAGHAGPGTSFKKITAMKSFYIPYFCLFLPFISFHLLTVLSKLPLLWLECRCLAAPPAPHNSSLLAKMFA